MIQGLPLLLLKLAAVPLVLLVIALLPLLGRLVLGPVSRAAGRLNAPTRFQLSDFVWLLIIVQVILAAVVRWIGIETRELFAIALGYMLFAAAALWGGAISYLSRAGVRDPRRRAAFILLIMPATLVLMIGVPAAGVVGIMNVLNWLERATSQYGSYNGSDLLKSLAALAAAAVVVPALVYGLRRAALWVATPPQIT